MKKIITLSVATFAVFLLAVAFALPNRASAQTATSTTYAITTVVNPSNTGVVVSSSTVTAIPISGYRFMNWTENGAIVSTSAAYTFTSSSSRTLVANFAPISLLPVVTITASPTSVVSGSSSIISWTSTNATSCVASGSWSGSKPLSGSQSTGALTATSSYTLSCIGSNGSSTAMVYVTVTPPSLYSLMASPSVVFPGATTTLTWSSPSVRSTHTTDWVALYKVGAANTSYGVHKNTGGCVTNCTFVTKVPLVVGLYEFRYLLDNGYTSVATSNQFTVSTTTVPAVLVSNVSTTRGVPNINTNSGSTTEQFLFSFSLTASNNPIYISKTQSAALGTALTGSLYSVVPVNFSDDNTSGDGSTYFYLAPGQTKTFTAIYAANGLSSQSGVFQVNAINVGTTQAGTGIVLNSSDIQNGLKAVLFSYNDQSFPVASAQTSAGTSLTASVWNAIKGFFGF